MIVRISVTQDDIAQGGCAGDDCPIYIAARRVLPKVPYLWVSKNEVSFDEEQYLIGDPAVVELPLAATEFIALHDNYRDGKPFEFDLEVPDDYAPAVTP